MLPRKDFIVLEASSIYRNFVVLTTQYSGVICNSQYAGQLVFKDVNICIGSITLDYQSFHTFYQISSVTVDKVNNFIIQCNQKILLCLDSMREVLFHIKLRPES
jgi:hypothetical protein